MKKLISYIQTDKGSKQLVYWERDDISINIVTISNYHIKGQVEQEKSEILMKYADVIDMLNSYR